MGGEEEGPSSGRAGDAAVQEPPRGDGPACTHHVAVPEGPGGWESLDPEKHGTLDAPAWRGPMAKEYPFRLDPFQETSVACLERREDVMVAAHTSAGKTVVAEYAISMAFRDNQKVIYTSPLKALSNQKYRDMKEQFGDVGLMTGDNSISPNATCIIMTTEILRSMLYRGSDLVREVAWVIFDEVHYMKDKERGVVWEETIMNLGRKVNMVFLSATLSNSMQFAKWISSLQQKPCHVVYTDQRPVPLQHYAFPQGGEGIFLVSDDRGFHDRNFKKMVDSFGTKQAGRVEKNSSDVNKILNLAKQNELEPVIVFSFSRKDCEQNALLASKRFDFQPEQEQKDYIEEVFKNALGACLTEEDMDLVPVKHMLPLLLKGIGVHHSGLLPLLKELVEILFQEHFIKVLFATETFAMGLNMPARTVVFTKLRKWDGEQFRWMGSGEYIQMSGRAGRRGKDKSGICIQIVDDEMDIDICRDIVSGRPLPLESTFKLSYYTLLNTLKRADGVMNQAKIISMSFHQFQHELKVPEMERELAELQQRAGAMDAQEERDIVEYNELRAEIRRGKGEVQAIVLRPESSLHFLRPGRLILIRDGDVEWGWGVAVSVFGKINSDQKDAENLVVDTLLPCRATEGGRPAEPLAPWDEAAGGPPAMVVVPVALKLVAELGLLRIHLPDDLRPASARDMIAGTLKGLRQRYKGALPALDPIDDMGMDYDKELVAKTNRLRKLQARLRQHPVHRAAEDPAGSAAVRQRIAALDRAADLKRAMEASQLAQFTTELRSRLAVLKKLGHVNEEGVVELKGKAACEVDTADELLVTELMFDGTFRDLGVPELAALCACMIPVDKSTVDAHLAKNELADAFRHLQDTAKRIAAAARECRLEVDEEEYVEGFRTSLMDVVYGWAKGQSFAQVSKMTDVFEGSIIRATRRLDELLQQIQAAFAAVGNHEMADKVGRVSAAIHRGIMFANSLYVDDPEEDEEEGGGEVGGGGSGSGSGSESASSE